MMKEINLNTKAAHGMMWDYRRAGYTDIYEAYGRPSARKVNAFREIEYRAMHTPGYNYDLKVIGRNCMQYSTIYSYTDADGQHIIKDTRDNTYHLLIPAGLSVAA